MTGEELVAQARGLAGPDVDVQMIDSADVVQDGIRHLHVRCLYRHKTTGRGNTIDLIYEEPASALSNPFGVPAWQLATGVGVAAVGGWLGWRLVTRNALKKLLVNSEMVKKATEKGLISWTPGEKAAQEISLVGMKTAAAAYVDVLDELRKIMPIEMTDMQNMTEDVKRIFEEKTGIDPDAVVQSGKSTAQSIYDSLPDVPLVDTSSWFSWAVGPTAKTGEKI